MSRLADLFPQPKMLTLGGGRWLVSQYRLRDLAFLQCWLESRQSDPLDDPALSDPDQSTRWAALRNAYEREEIPPPSLGSSEAEAAFSTPEGAGWLVWLSLVQCLPALTHTEAVEIASEMTAGEWAAFDRAAWSLDLLSEIDDRINAELGIRLPTGTRDEGNLAKAYLDFNEHTRITLTDFGNLTLSQWRTLASGGQKRDTGVPQPDGWSTEKFEAEYLDKRLAFFVPTGSPPDHPADPETSPGEA